MRRVMCALLVLLIAASCAGADQSSSPVQPEVATSSPTSTPAATAVPATPHIDVQADAAAALDQMLSRGCHEDGVPGMSAAIVSRDGPLWMGTCGDAYAGEAVNPDHLFQIGSVTKTFTAALLLDLVAEGSVQLEDDVATMLPDVEVPPGVTLRDLLQHTSGIADYTDDPDLLPAMQADFSRVWTARDVLDTFNTSRLRDPGTNWSYSNTNYLLAGLVAESVGEQPVHVLLRERILEPGALDSVCFDAAEVCVGERAHGYVDIDDDGTAEDLTALVPGTSFATSAGTAGALVATAADSATWMREHASGNSMGEREYRELTRWLDRGDGLEYGLGLIRDERDDADWLGHKGNTAGYSASVWYSPDYDVAVAVLSNAHLIDVTPMAFDLIEVVVATN